MGRGGVMALFLATSGIDSVPFQLGFSKMSSDGNAKMFEIKSGS